ncbi:MAG: PAS domain-containing protein [Bacteriovoracaceae bacterium]|nr:PAS domain-containing protein [Bacteriovoracaceae bacterium]
MSFEIFDNFIDGVLIFDDQRHLLYANQAMANIVGSSLKRLKPGKMITDFLTLKNDSLFFMDGGTEGRDAPSQYKEMDFDTYKGLSGKMLVMVRPYFPDESGQNQFLCFFRDMTLEVKLHDKYRAELLEKEAVNVELRKAKVELEQYSKNLEKMVQERTRELQKANQFVTAMVNSLDQGLFVFNDEGNCLPNYTKACEDIFDTSPKGKKLWDVISTGEQDCETLIKWTSGLFQEIIPFKDYAELGPQKIELDDKFIKLDYFPMRDEDENLEAVVTVATDKTKEHTAECEAKKNKEYVQMVLKLVQNKEQFLGFVSDSKKMIHQMELSITKLKQGENDLPNLLRYLHSIKGGAGIFNIQKVQEMAHDYETDLEEHAEDEDFKSYLPTLEENIQNLGNKLKEFYAESAGFLGKSVIDGKNRVEITVDQLKKFSEKMGNSIQDRELVQEFEEIFIKEPIYKFFTSYSEMIMDMAKDQGKCANPIKFEGGDVRINPETFSELFNTLVHAFTNAIDHGLEPTEQRVELGKDPKGNIIVRFSRLRQGEISFLHIDIQDDGSGVDPQKIKEKLIATGREDIASSETDHQLIQHIFDSQFSTKEQVSKTSGRGVGADAIRNVVEEMGGVIEVSSTLGRGSLLSIVVPESVVPKEIKKAS